MIPFESLGTVSFSHSIVTMALPFIISDLKRDIGRKSRFFHTPTAFDAPVRGLRRNTAIRKKTRMVWLPDGEKLRILLLVLTEYPNITDGRTVRPTDTARRHRPRLCIVWRGKNVGYGAV